MATWYERNGYRVRLANASTLEYAESDQLARFEITPRDRAIYVNDARWVTQYGKLPIAERDLERLLIRLHHYLHMVLRRSDLDFAIWDTRHGRLEAWVFPEERAAEALGDEPAKPQASNDLVVWTTIGVFVLLGLVGMSLMSEGARWVVCVSVLPVAVLSAVVQRRRADK